MADIRADITAVATQVATTRAAMVDMAVPMAASNSSSNNNSSKVHTAADTAVDMADTQAATTAVIRVDTQAVMDTPARTDPAQSWSLAVLSNKRNSNRKPLPCKLRLLKARKPKLPRCRPLPNRLPVTTRLMRNRTTRNLATARRRHRASTKPPLPSKLRLPPRPKVAPHRWPPLPSSSNNNSSNKPLAPWSHLAVVKSNLKTNLKYLNSKNTKYIVSILLIFMPLSISLSNKTEKL